MFPLNALSGSPEQVLTMRSVPGARVPKERLDHCDMGTILLKDLKKSEPQRLPKNHQKLVSNRALVAEEMERRRHAY